MKNKSIKNSGSKKILPTNVEPHLIVVTTPLNYIHDFLRNLVAVAWLIFGLELFQCQIGLSLRLLLLQWYDLEENRVGDDLFVNNLLERWT